MLTFNRFPVNYIYITVYVVVDFFANELHEHTNMHPNFFSACNENHWWLLNNKKIKSTSFDLESKGIRYMLTNRSWREINKEKKTIHELK